MLLRRLLATKNVEVYELKPSLYDIVKFYMILVDFRRESRHEDFPYLDEEDFSPRENYIQAIILYHDNITDSDKEMTYEIASGFLEDKDDCDWSMNYVLYDFNQLKTIAVDNEELINKINGILNVLGCDIKLENIDLKTFKYLNQQN